MRGFKVAVIGLALVAAPVLAGNKLIRRGSRWRSPNRC